jgi:type I restriction enzyme S subunit
MLIAAYSSITEGSPTVRLGDVAPLHRRPVEMDVNAEYPELGIRSFGKGTFHKPALPGALVGTKKLFAIRQGDLLFNIVFAWEGAVAVAQPEDDGRVGSHRFLTCVPDRGSATAEYLCFHFLTDSGLEQLGSASPGGAGRNRTLGLKALEAIRVPMPPLSNQTWFVALLERVRALHEAQASADEHLNALLPSILDKAFRGEL